MSWWPLTGRSRRSGRPSPGPRRRPSSGWTGPSCGGERYPVLTTYQQVVDVEGYAAPLKGLLARLEETYGYSREDAFLVLKDILGNIWQGKA